MSSHTFNKDGPNSTWACYYKFPLIFDLSRLGWHTKKFNLLGVAPYWAWQDQFVPPS